MEIRRLTTFDGTEAAAWYEAWHAGATADRHAALVTARDTQLRSLADNDTNPNRHREAWGAWDSGTVIAEVHVPRGRQLEDWPGGRFALARGFASGLAEERLVLDLPVPEKILGRRDRPAAGYRASTWHGPMPGRWLATLAELTTEMATDVPTGDLDVEAARWDADRVGVNQERLTRLGYALVTTVITTDAGEPAGYTQLLVDGDGVNVHQDDTYVRKAHRGHRLGALAKARNLRELVARHPQARHLHTWTAETNDAMRAINERFGFRPVETTHSMEWVSPGAR